MKIIAGVDIKSGNCVQISKNETSIISKNPIEFCQSLKEKGIQYLQIVDLDGVFTGETKILNLVKKIKNTVQIPIQFGGGIRNFKTAKEILEAGIDQIVLGTSAVNNQELLIDLLEAYPNRIIVAADVYKGYVYTEGWEANSSTSITEFLKTLQLIHVPHVLITDISKDGTLSGVDASLLESTRVFDKINISLSGGIHSDEIIKHLEEYQIYSVVITTAIVNDLITI
jgi:phosphoribosylformimino-5-aminoimidazole carboxamide ribotide isomerase